MSDLINIPTRPIKNLTLVPNTTLDLGKYKNVKVPVGNLPEGSYGEAFDMNILSRVLGHIMTSSTGVAVSKGDVVAMVNQEKIRAMAAEEILRKGITDTNYGSGKAYKTLAEAQADAANIPVNTPVIITNEIDPRANGVYAWDGVNFNKSQYDYFEMAKDYANYHYDNIDRRLLSEIIGLKNIFSALTNPNKNNQEPFNYMFSVEGRYYKTGLVDKDGGYDIHQRNYMHTGLIYLPPQATIKVRVYQQNVNNQSDVSSLLILNTALEKMLDLSRGNETEYGIESGMEWMEYEYQATEACYAVATTIRFSGDREHYYAHVTAGTTSFREFNTRSSYDRYLVRQIAAMRQANARLTSSGTDILYPMLEAGRIDVNGFNDLSTGGDQYSASYRSTGLIPLEQGDVVKAKVKNPDLNIQAYVVYDQDLNILEFGKDDTIEPFYLASYEYWATQRCYIVFCTINKTVGNLTPSDLELCARVTPYGDNHKRLHSYDDKFARSSTISDMAASKIEENIPFNPSGSGYSYDGQLFSPEVSPEYSRYYKGTSKIPVTIGDTIDFLVYTAETGGVMSVLNTYNQYGEFIRCVYTIQEFGLNGKVDSGLIRYVSDINGFVTVTSIDHGTTPYVIKNRNSALSKAVRNVNADVVKEDLFFLPKPTSLIKIDLKLERISAPDTKADGSIKGYARISCDGTEIESHVEASVQGDSSAAYPKKNLSLDFYTDERRKDDRYIKIGDLLPHATLVYKANWIDATHTRNIASNRLWEIMVQDRKGYPKREVERVYVGQNGTGSNNTGALGHAEGFPCVMYLNNKFYGIGTLNIHKKRENYNLVKDVKTQVHFNPMGGGVDFAAAIPPTQQLELRNPKLKGYNEGDEITDKVVRPIIDKLWAYHRLPLDQRIAKFDENYDRTNVVDWILLLQFTAAADLIDKNSLYTTWDGKKFCIMPFDLDTTYGLHWNGAGLGYAPNWNWDNMGILNILIPVVINDMKKRYAELRTNGIFTVDTVYRLTLELETKFGRDLFNEEQKRWTDIPSRNFGGVYQILDWLKDRIKYLDAKYDFKDQGVLAQQLWNPPRLAAGGTQTLKMNVAGLAVGTPVVADFGLSLQGTKMTAEVLTVGVVTVTHNNPTAGEVNLDVTAIRILEV